MTVGFDIGPLTTPGASASRGARVYARASRSVASDQSAPRSTPQSSPQSSPQSTPQSTRITSTEVGLNLGKFQVSYTSHELTVDIGEVVRDALGRTGRSARTGRAASFAEELDLARAQQAASDRPSRTAPSSDASPTATPRRAALAYAKAQGLDSPAAAMYSLGSIQPYYR